MTEYFVIRYSTNKDNRVCTLRLSTKIYTPEECQGWIECMEACGDTILETGIEDWWS